jgi:hypothetical protein
MAGARTSEVVSDTNAVTSLLAADHNILCGSRSSYSMQLLLRECLVDCKKTKWPLPEVRADSDNQRSIGTRQVKLLCYNGEFWLVATCSS